MSPAGNHRPSSRRRLRRRVYELLDPTLRTWWDLVVHYGLMGLVLANVASVVLASVPAIEARHRGLFTAIEIVSAAIFTLEFLLRIWTAAEHAPYAGAGPWRARLRYLTSGGALVDLLAVVPFYLLLLGSGDLRTLALFRLVRYFKLARYSPGVASLIEAVHAERRALFGCLVILGGLVLTMASLMHLVEGSAQPERFGTVPDAMWWAVITLTTVGYGDAVPVTALGKAVASVTAVMGLVLLALPVGIVATAFSEVIHRRSFVVTWTMVARVPLFSGLGAAEIAEITGLLHSRSVRRGEVITRRGEEAGAMYFVVDGEVEVELRHRAEVRLGPGEFFGEIALLIDEGKVRTATVRATRNTDLLVLDAHDLDRLMARMPEIRERLHAVSRARAPHRMGEGEDGPQS